VGLVRRFAPPGYLPDFAPIPGQLDAWHNAVSSWFDASINQDRPLVNGGTFQFFNPATFDPAGIAIEQAITWNAFPKELLRQFGRERALKEADSLWTLDRYYSDLGNVAIDRAKYPQLFQVLFRPQDEYCEWHVERDSLTGKILRVTFTSEPPEYWFALFGESAPGDPNQFPGDRNVVLNRYREFVSPAVQPNDLLATTDIVAPNGTYATKGHYNPYNKWNTTHGIVHLGAPPNSLTAEIQLGADATVLRRDGRGRLLVEPEALICCARYGGPDRNSDPTIGAAVNALSRLGAFVTLANPVGLYMDHIDLAGWQAPDGQGVESCVRTVRGMPQMIERLVVEVPSERGFAVGDITIGGEPIDYGGQIAECITVKLTGIAHISNEKIANAPVACDGRCCVDEFHAVALKRSISIDQLLPPGTRAAYFEQGAIESVSGQPEAALGSARRVPIHSALGIRRRAYTE
jgi:hypothetical protein